MLHQHNATTFLLLGLSIALPRGVRSHVLVKEGFRLVKQSSNDGKLTSGGSSQGASYYSGGDCSSIKYVDACSDVEGARFYERDGLDGIYVVDGDAVTKCSRYRSEWQCNQCTLGRCNFSSGENFGGSTTTYRLEPSPGGIASLASLDGRDYCYKACTNADGTIAIGDEDAEAECAKGDGWYLVDEGYDTPCDISGTHECRESGRSCTSYSLSRGWSDDCCPGSYCSGSSDRCREHVRNERMCRTNNQPCSLDADCCVGYACSDFVYQSAARACKSISDDCTEESWKPDEDDPCCEGTEEAEMVDEDGETIVYCKATPNGIAAQSASGTSDGGGGGGGENQKDVTVNDSDKDSGNAGSNGGDIFSASEACADLGQVEAHMTASFKTMLPGTPVTTGYDCKCTEPDPATVQIDCTLPYSRDGEDFTNFERAILGTISPASTQLVLKSIAWGDTVYNPVGYFQETFVYDEAGESMTSCTANGCATCEICPDGESFAVDCSALPGDLAFILSCGDVSTTTFLAEYYSGNPTQLNKDKSASPIRGHGFSNFLGISTLLMIHAIFIY